ncbi:ecotin family protein [Sphingobacterium sp. SG20118]|uniref:ecotin family protein n=1 Tax=Sphingobacterium TaxID=28453 RepID=UPI0004F83FC7|nr:MULTISPECIES: ecotin family protein [Sphingobacterium]AIM36400.1 proteinase inhibitor [Sphingobacterium sp. ML3W]MDH5827458.1 ecotin family protein [Sphingobacterium faecium]
MKKLMLQTGMIVATLLFSISAMAQTLLKQDVNVFPAPEKGMVKYVIEVPHAGIAADNNKKIEFFAGKYMETDACNTYFLSGEFEEKNLEGWGYNYYVFKTNGNVGMTQMLCEGEKKNTFVQAKSIVSDYNGRMPIVIYAPEGYEVKFKIYKAEPETYQAAQVTVKKAK